MDEHEPRHPLEVRIEADPLRAELHGLGGDPAVIGGDWSPGAFEMGGNSTEAIRCYA